MAAATPTRAEPADVGKLQTALEPFEGRCACCGGPVVIVKGIKDGRPGHPPPTYLRCRQAVHCQSCTRMEVFVS